MTLKSKNYLDILILILFIVLFSKYSNKNNLTKYIKNLETSINKMKIKESEQIENIDELQYRLEKQEKVNENLKDQIEKLKSKLKNVPVNHSNYSDDTQ
jgi:uncharacterized coiled-coil protein SlyX